MALQNLKQCVDLRAVVEVADEGRFLWALDSVGWIEGNMLGNTRVQTTILAMIDYFFQTLRNQIFIQEKQRKTRKTDPKARCDPPRRD